LSTPEECRDVLEVIWHAQAIARRADAYERVRDVTRRAEFALEDLALELEEVRRAG
jgi:hypothetical protein